MIRDEFDRIKALVEATKCPPAVDEFLTDCLPEVEAWMDRLAEVAKELPTILPALLAECDRLRSLVIGLDGDPDMPIPDESTKKELSAALTAAHAVNAALSGDGGEVE